MQISCVIDSCLYTSYTRWQIQLNLILIYGQGGPGPEGAPGDPGFPGSVVNIECSDQNWNITSYFKNEQSNRREKKRVCVQGARGFPGLPGNPGIKGQKVSHTDPCCRLANQNEEYSLTVDFSKRETLVCLDPEANLEPLEQRY